MDEYIHRFSGQQIDDAVEAVINGNVGGGGGETGEDGGYYIPSVVQTDEYTARFSFTPSKDEMNEVADVDVDLPPGADGKSAYAYAQDGGYTGTEAEFAEKLAEETPGIHIGAEAPTDDSVLWVDTDEEESAEAVPSDWNAAEGEPGHILNRPFYKESAELVNGTAAYNADMDSVCLETDAQLISGETYAVTYNGVEYTCTAFELDDGEGNVSTLVGNGAAIDLEDTGEPFLMVILEGVLIVNDLNGATEATIRIMEEQIVPIPHKYLPPLSYVIDVADGEDKSGSSGNITIDFDHNGLYDTTELYEALKNGWPIYLDITAMNNGIESRLLVTSWRTVYGTLDEQVAEGRLSCLAVLLYAHEYTESTDRWWHAYIN